MKDIGGALDNIIRIMDVTENEKAKRVEVLADLEKKVARRLQKGQIKEAIEELKDIIDDYKRLGLNQKAQVLELTLNQLLIETNETIIQMEQPLISKDKQAIIQVLENRSKKVIRRFLQGKTDDAIQEMNSIINGFRELKMLDRAQALNDWMFQFLGKKLEYEEEQKPLSERLSSDPELEQQLLSFRTQKVLKRFIQGKHRKAVMEYNEIVNDYKRQGKLNIVETLELWFNLFITKNYLIPAKPSEPPLEKSVRQKPPSPVENSESPDTSSKEIPSSENYKEKISKIKNLLKQFEDSI